MQDLRKRTTEADFILKHANMGVKRWIFSGDDDVQTEIGKAIDVIPQEASVERMLGVVWDPVRDVFKFVVQINLSPLKNKFIKVGIVEESSQDNQSMSILLSSSILL